MNRLLVCCFVTAALVFCGVSFGDTFGSGANSFEVDFVTIGNPGNSPDTTGNPNPAGSVPYSYRIGKYEISEQMIDKANTLGGLGIGKSSRGPDKPVTNITWFDAARFANWLNMSTGNTPAYKFDGSGNFELWQPGDAGYDPYNVYRNRLATYFLPSADEWYKAAYYDPATGMYFDFPNGSNAPPTAVANGSAPGTAVYDQASLVGPADTTLAGGLSPYGTMAQGGNVNEWEETDLDLINDSISSYRGARGGTWSGSFAGLEANTRVGQFPSIPSGGIGFRIGSTVPEPTVIALITCGCFAFLGTRRRSMSHGRSNDAESFDRFEKCSLQSRNNSR